MAADHLPRPEFDGYKTNGPHSTSHPRTFYHTIKVSMPDNLAAGTFRIVSLTGGEGNHFAGVTPDAEGVAPEPQPIRINLPLGANTTV